MTHKRLNVWRLIIEHPRAVLACCALITLLLALQLPNLRLEVSADALVLENDSALAYYQNISARYQNDEYLILTYAPHTALFEDAQLRRLESLHNWLETLSGVASVNSILNVPLLFSPKISMTQLGQPLPTLLAPSANLEQAKIELSTSPLYGDRLLSSDLSTTALQINFTQDEAFLDLRDARQALRLRKQKQGLSPSEQQQLRLVETAYRQRHAAIMEEQEALVSDIRSGLREYTSEAEIRMGGLPLIVVDMMRFIRHDIQLFGVLVAFTMGVLLWWAFKSWQWLVFSLLSVAVSAVWVSGIVAALGWPVTAISANYIALLLIFGLSLLIHLIVQFRERQVSHPHQRKDEWLQYTLNEKFSPSFFTVITTIVAFLSLVISDIRPVIDFGGIMVIALLVNLLLAFTLFPALIQLKHHLPVPRLRDWTEAMMQRMAHIALTRNVLLTRVFVVVVMGSVIGLSFLSVDNRFIDYFDESTDIYTGMVTIDQKLGGTTPLDVIIDAPAQKLDIQNPTQTMSQTDESLESAAQDAPFSADPFSEDPFSDNPFEETSSQPPSSALPYWLQRSRLDTVQRIHAFLDEFNDTGKVLSLNTTISTLERLNNNQPMDDFFLSLFYQNLSADLHEVLIAPYLSEDGRQLRFALRVYESDKDLDRQALLDEITDGLVEKLELQDEQIHVTGMMVLYNNLLQSLFNSQINTLFAVFTAIFLLFIIVFRSLKIAAIAIVPNLFSALAILGIIGFSGIPLDLMTITVAGISVGIAVDDTIHYMHRLKAGWNELGDYQAAIQQAHKSIGKAMFYTSVTIALGFAVMTFSQFSPTIYFGVFTAIAMLTAMLANMTLLPMLVRRYRPYS